MTTTVLLIHIHTTSNRPTLTLLHSKHKVAVANEQVYKSGQFSVSAFRVQTIQNTLRSVVENLSFVVAAKIEQK